jgi:hypothetical protein
VTNPAVVIERDAALLDVQRIVAEYGSPLVVMVRGEANLTRDLYNSVAGRPTDAPRLSIFAFPLIHDPNDRQVEKAGLREKYQAIAWTAMKDWTDGGMTFATIDAERTTVVVESRQYRVKEKGQASVFGDTALYVTLGLERI